MRIRYYVEQRLKGKYINGRYHPGLSPELISKRISIELPGESISHEAIYQWVLVEAKHLIKYLDRLGKYRRRRKRTENIGRKRISETKRHISARPEEANKRTELGHIERDAIESCKEGRSAVLNSVDRKTRYLRATLIADLKAKSGKDATIRMFRSEPQEAMRTMTNDNGSENGEQASIEAVLGVEVFYCTPYAAWERGSVERANRTLRRIFPKGTNFDEVTEQDLQLAVQWYNNRPMKLLNGKTPAEAYQEELLKLKKAA
jgi:IS30 family transposase